MSKEPNKQPKDKSEININLIMCLITALSGIGGAFTAGHFLVESNNQSVANEQAQFVIEKNRQDWASYIELVRKYNESYIEFHDAIYLQKNNKDYLVQITRKTRALGYEIILISGPKMAKTLNELNREMANLIVTDNFDITPLLELHIEFIFLAKEAIHKSLYPKPFGD